jgi:hypothetical protein
MEGGREKSQERANYRDQKCDLVASPPPSLPSYLVVQGQRMPRATRHSHDAAACLEGETNRCRLRDHFNLVHFHGSGA